MYGVSRCCKTRRRKVAFEGPSHNTRLTPYSGMWATQFGRVVGEPCQDPSPTGRISSTSLSHSLSPRLSQIRCSPSRRLPD